nr:glycoside hydrolase family 1 [Phyllotreta armoraciae]
MFSFYYFTILLISVCLGEDVINNRRFPPDFIFSAATSAYQVEGGWNEDGKSPSIWDTTVHNNPAFIDDTSNGDIACDSYHKIEEDVAILKELGVTHYRLSIAWTRILPNGIGEVNEAGVAYYKKLIKELNNNGISPFVTIFHWDMPQALQDMGGILNSSFVSWYSDYARECFKHFGDDVQYWLTFNEPQQVCTGGYGYGYFPPTVKSEGLLEYLCVYHVVKSHAKAWHIYDSEFRSKQNGKISITLDTGAFLPASNSSSDKEAADRMLHFTLGVYANPIYVGDFPEVVKTRVATRSAAEGRNQSRLPELTQDEIDYIRGTHDFFGLNVYSASVAEAMADPPVQNPPSKWQDQGVNTFIPADWEGTSQELTKVVPWTVRSLLNWIKDAYNNPGIIITENGYPSKGDKDDRRLYYIRGYLSYIRDTMIEDDVSVLGYTVWSLMDNFEWTSGYTQKYGLYEVDFNSPNRTRTIRPSGEFYRKVTQTRCLVDNCIE